MVWKHIQELLKKQYRIENGKHFMISDHDPSDTGGISLSKKEAKKLLKKRIKVLSSLQELLYANETSALLVVLQGMDTSGKDGTIKHVTSGINPQGISVTSFKQPGPVEVIHDYLWRVHLAAPARGKIAIFNRSHYEEVLVTKVHPSILEKQKIPTALLNNANFWQSRYQDICNFEEYIARQGFGVIKVFLNISKEEQRQRLLARLDNQDKQWKFSISDPKERQFWEQYQAAYQEAIAQTSTKQSPWIVVPADNKWYARLVVVEAMILELENLHLTPPKPLPEILASLDELKQFLGEEVPKNKKNIDKEKKKVKK